MTVGDPFQAERIEIGLVEDVAVGAVGFDNGQGLRIGFVALGLEDGDRHLGPIQAGRLGELGVDQGAIVARRGRAELDIRRGVCRRVIAERRPGARPALQRIEHAIMTCVCVDQVGGAVIRCGDGLGDAVEPDAHKAVDADLHPLDVQPVLCRGRRRDDPVLVLGQDDTGVGKGRAGLGQVDGQDAAIGRILDRGQVQGIAKDGEACNLVGIVDQAAELRVAGDNVGGRGDAGATFGPGAADLQHAPARGRIAEDQGKFIGDHRHAGYASGGDDDRIAGRVGPKHMQLDVHIGHGVGLAGRRGHLGVGEAIIADPLALELAPDVVDAVGQFLAAIDIVDFDTGDFRAATVEVQRYAPAVRRRRKAGYRGVGGAGQRIRVEQNLVAAIGEADMQDRLLALVDMEIEDTVADPVLAAIADDGARGGGELRLPLLHGRRRIEPGAAGNALRLQPVTEPGIVRAFHPAVRVGNGQAVEVIDRVAGFGCGRGRLRQGGRGQGKPGNGQQNAMRYTKATLGHGKISPERRKAKHAMGRASR